MNVPDDYLLTCIQEEAAEVIHAICKIQRFGLEDFHPKKNKNNKDHLREEWYQLVSLMDRAFQVGLVGEWHEDELDKVSRNKHKKVQKYYDLYKEKNG